VPMTYFFQLGPTSCFPPPPINAIKLWTTNGLICCLGQNPYDPITSQKPYLWTLHLGGTKPSTHEFGRDISCSNYNIHPFFSEFHLHGSQLTHWFLGVLVLSH
jgi:hypothetical protein